MPELADVARALYFIRKHLVGKTIAKVEAVDDEMIFGKTGITAAGFEAAVKGKTINGAGRHGKYLYLALSNPPHVIMHFGMTGWLHIKDVKTQAYGSNEGLEWPPRFNRARLYFKDGKTEASFADQRRLGRIFVVDCEANAFRNNPPLISNGPDPLEEKDLITEDYIKKKIKGKTVAIKGLLLNQEFISGLGNWMADEVLYHAEIHPEQKSFSLTPEQIHELRTAIQYVCNTSVDLRGREDQYPSDWLFHYRKRASGKENFMPNGDKIEFLKVGGRTSVVVPAMQSLEAYEDRRRRRSNTLSQSPEKQRGNTVVNSAVRRRNNRERSESPLARKTQSSDRKRG